MARFNAMNFLHCFCILSVFVFTSVKARPTGTVELSNENDAGELILVQAIFRHGDRTPISLYHNDPYNNYTWDDGLGSLTLRGKARMYHYGETIRKRYSSYVENILAKNVQAQSSFKRRCLETTLSVLAGLVPPTNASHWSQSHELAKLWQPIAVETTESSRAWLLNPDTECAAATAVKNAIPTEDPVLKAFLEKNKDFVQRVSQHSGQHFPSWIEVGWVYDAIFTERNFFGDQFKMPEWLSKVGNDTLARLKQFNDFQFSIYANWPKYVKLRAGLLLKQTIDNMRGTAAIKEPLTAKNRQLFLYGTHDTMVSPVMLALGYLKEQPTYGSGVIIELRKHPQTKVPHVHVFYANVTNNAQIADFTTTFTRLELNHSERFSKLCHEASCSLDNFAASLKDYLVSDIEKECSLPK